ncbi:MAG: hypothetical protein QOE70_6524 [Chthoniobacter sp.]|jgi:predicted GIY-YIG superfamily endonuclease|nr:hypothetical protein [Chthoniobacter sp.]
MADEFWVYIMSNKTRTTLYTGMTNNLLARVWQRRHPEGNSFAARYSTNRLVFHEGFPTALEAIAAEKRIKGWTRAKKNELIRKQNPNWVDLAGIGMNDQAPPCVSMARTQGSQRCFASLSMTAWFFWMERAARCITPSREGYRASTGRGGAPLPRSGPSSIASHSERSEEPLTSPEQFTRAESTRPIRSQRCFASLSMTAWFWMGALRARAGAARGLGLLSLAALFLSALVAHAAEPAQPQAGKKPVATPAPAPERRELWVPSDRLKEVLAKFPKAVVLSREQYEKLLRDAGFERKKASEAPRKVALSEAQYTARVEGKALQVTAEFLVHVLSDDWSQLPLEFGGATVGAVRIDGEAAWLSARPEASRKGAPNAPATLLLRGRGDRQLAVDFAVPIASQPGLKAVRMSLPRASTNSLDIELPAGVRVESSHAIKVSTTPQATIVTAAISAADPTFDLTWRSAGVAAAQVALEARATALFEIDGERITVEQEFTVAATLGVLPLTFRLVIPPTARVLSVEGDELSKWALAEGRVVVDLQPGDRTTTAIRMRLELPALGNADLKTIDLALPDLEGVARLSGWFAIAADPGVSVKSITVDPTITQTSGAVTDGRGEITAAYDFAGRPAAPRVAVERVQPRFNADLDTRVEFKPEAIFIDRTITLREEKGELFQAAITLPAGEELLSVRRADATEPEWQRLGAKVVLRWSATTEGKHEHTFKLCTRLEPEKWTQPGPDGHTFQLDDVKIDGVQQVTGYIALQADPAFRLEASPSETLERRDGRTTPVQGDYAWFRRDEFTLTVKVARRPGEVLAALTGYALPMEGVLDLHAQLGFEFLHSGVKSVRVKVPEKIAANFYFDGPQIAERNLAGDTWTIVFQKELTGAYALEVTAQVPVEKPPVADTEARFTIDVPVITPLDVQRVSGVWAVEANTETEITFTAKSMNELDSLLAPTLAGYQPRHRVIGVFAWLGPTYTLQLSGVRHPAAKVLTSVVDRLDLDTVISTSGADRNEARFQLRTAGAQYLDVKLPAGSALLSLSVEGAPIKPVGGAPDVVRIQLPAKRDASWAIPVSLLYETRRSEWSSGGAEELRAPQFAKDIPVLRSKWTLFLPDGFEYTRVESNLRVPEAMPERPLITIPLDFLEGCSVAQFQAVPVTRANRAVSDGGMATPPPTAPMAQSANPPAQTAPADRERASTEEMQRKLEKIIIPRLEFREATVREAVEFLSRKTGINIALQAPSDSSGARITVSLTNIPASEALRYVTNLAGLKSRIDPKGVVIVPGSANTDVLITKEYKVRPDLIGRGPAVPEDTTRGGAGIAEREKAKDWLISNGVQFGSAASAIYLPSASKLIVRNTQEQLDLLDTIMASREAGQAAQAQQTAGLLPMKFDLPKIGYQISLAGLTAAERVSFHYEDWWGRARRLWIWFVAGGLGCLAVARRRPWWRTGWAALVLTFWPLVVSPAAMPVCNALFGGWLVSLALQRLARWLVFAPRRKEVFA